MKNLTIKTARLLQHSEIEGFLTSVVTMYAIARTNFKLASELKCDGVKAEDILLSTATKCSKR